jgi:hypothetical protein
MAAWAFFKKREMKGIKLKPAIFYGTYVHSEKPRIKEGELKNKKRLEIQSIHAKDGGWIRRGGGIGIFVGWGRGRRWISIGSLVFLRFETMRFFGVLSAFSIVGIRYG